MKRGSGSRVRCGTDLALPAVWPRRSGHGSFTLTSGPHMRSVQELQPWATPACTRSPHTSHGWVRAIRAELSAVATGSNRFSRTVSFGSNSAANATASRALRSARTAQRVYLSTCPRSRSSAWRGLPAHRERRAPVSLPKLARGVPMSEYLYRRLAADCLRRAIEATDQERPALPWRSPGQIWRAKLNTTAKRVRIHEALASRRRARHSW